MVAGRVDSPATSEAAFLCLLSRDCVYCIGVGPAGSINNFATSFGASRNDPFVLSPPFVAFLVRRALARLQYGLGSRLASNQVSTLALTP